MNAAVLASTACETCFFNLPMAGADLLGKPDLANKKQAWAIFVHGCFWHSHRGCKLASSPKSNTGYWREKLNGNQTRDANKIAALHSMGFRVLIMWECDVRDCVRLTGHLRNSFRKLGKRLGEGPRVLVRLGVLEEPLRLLV